MMLKLKLQYFGHLMRKVDSLEKTLMLGEIGGRRRRVREFVQEPMNTLSIRMSVMRMFGVRPMYSSARSVACLVLLSDIARGSGTCWSTPVTIPGLVPQLTCGAISSALNITVAS